MGTGSGEGEAGMRDENDRFLDAFEEVAGVLRRRSGLAHGSAGDLVKAAVQAKNDGFITAEECVLVEDCNPLRNSLAHNRVNGCTMLVVTDEVLTRIEKLRCRLVGRLPTVERFRGEVTTIHPEATLVEACATMKANNFSSLPVVTEDGVHGLLSGNDIVCWVGRQLGDIGLLEDALVGQVMSEHAETDYRLVRRDTPCHDVSSMFADAASGGCVLGAVLVTNTGRAHEPLLGIITPWDAAKLN